jgi:hypothetical protein
MFRRPESVTPAHSGQEDLVLLCGGTELHHEVARSRNGDLLDESTTLVVGDVESLLRCAPRSQAVIVCGELAGMSAYTVERLITQRAPQTRLIRADRAFGAPGSARRRARRGVLGRLSRPAAVAR